MYKVDLCITDGAGPQLMPPRGVATATLIQCLGSLSEHL